VIDKFRGGRVTAGFWLLPICAVLPGPANAARAEEKFIARDAEVAGARIHYLINSGFVSLNAETRGGHGPAVILLHGYAETSRMWALSKTKLTMPVLSIGGDKSLGVPLGEQAKLVANDVTMVVVKDSGHWIMEEQPKQTDGCASAVFMR
jgi:pimeloyl-ACP methyl ester carboxylesterase